MYQFFYFTDMLIPCCTGVQYKELVVGINLLPTTSDVPRFGGRMRSSLSVFLLAQFFFGSCVFGSNQTQMDCGPNSLDVTLFCRQKWVSKGLREPTILVSPTYSQHLTLHIQPIILCK